MKKSKFVFLLLGLLFLGACEKKGELGNLVPKTADQDPSIPSIVVNDRTLHSEAFGHPDSMLVVCIHGGPSADYRYMLRAKDLTDHGYRVVFYDQVGSGLSQRFDESYYDGKDLDDIFLDELKGVINHYKTSAGQKIVLFGHSWGAIMATAYAGKYPDEVHGLALIEPGGLKWDDIVDYITRSQSVPLWSEMVNDILYQDQFFSTKKDNHEVLDYKLTLLASHGNPNTHETITGKDGFWRFGAVINLISFNYGEANNPDLGEGIEHYTRPVLFMHGGKGKVYTDEWAQRISAVYPNKEVFKIEGVGHSGMLEAGPWSTTTLPKLLNYLNSL
jgi:proline iminopeptidase